MLSSLIPSNFANEVFSGALLSTNIMDVERTHFHGNKGYEMGLVGPNGFRMSAENPLSISTLIRQPSLRTMSMGETAMSVGSLGLGTIPGLYFGYQESGLRGAATYVAGDVAAMSAMLRHHYSPALKGGNYAGKVIAPGLWTGLGGSSTLGTRAFNSMSYIGKGIGGGIGGYIGGSLGNKVGGAVAGDYGRFTGQVAGTFAGSYLGTATAASMGGAAIAGAVPIGVLGATALGTTAIVGSGALAGYGTYQMLKAGYQNQQYRKSIQTSGSLAAFNTQGAHTMRQRAVQAIHKSHLNARSALGQEAQYMSFPNKNYHSNYRRFY